MRNDENAKTIKNMQIPSDLNSLGHHTSLTWAPFGTQVDPLEPYKDSGELSWGALGAVWRRLGCQNGTKIPSRVLTGAKWRPFKMDGKTRQK